MDLRQPHEDAAREVVLVIAAREATDFGDSEGTSKRCLTDGE
jgi:hypothetical protein